MEQEWVACSFNYPLIILLNIFAVFKKALCQIWFLRNSRNIQRDFKPELLNVINPWIKKGRINFEYFYLDIKVIIFLVDWGCC